jgi:hypothetical protein
MLIGMVLKMHISRKLGRNDLCMCGSGKKYKYCCEGKVDWNSILKMNADPLPYLSIRGKNLDFMSRMMEVLDIERDGTIDISDYKSRFTASSVRKINEAVVEAWPRDTDIVSVLKRKSTDVSGLYIGDYNLRFLERAIVRHSIYANKILIVDPFVYPYSLRNEFNPIIEPEQYRAQTLKNVNFWRAIYPWIVAGIVEVIRSPADFDAKLNWDSLNRQEKKFAENPDLQRAAEETANELHDRHFGRMHRQMVLLSMPDDVLAEKLREMRPEADGITVEDLLKHIRAERLQDADFLEPMAGNSGQFHMFTSGASYDIAQLTARMTGSYLVTDLHSKWKEIELDRSLNNAENRIWSPFAKALQETPLKYLNGLSLQHALKLRTEGRLEHFRAFLFKVWKSAGAADPYDETNARLLAEELGEQVAKAEQEWTQIGVDLTKMVGASLTSGLLAGPMISPGNALFFAAAGVVAAATTVGTTAMKMMNFPDRFPAAFFMDVKEK